MIHSSPAGTMGRLAVSPNAGAGRRARTSTGLRQPDNKGENPPRGVFLVWPLRFQRSPPAGRETTARALCLFENGDFVYNGSQYGGGEIWKLRLTGAVEGGT